MAATPKPGAYTEIVFSSSMGRMYVEFRRRSRGTKDSGIEYIKYVDVSNVDEIINKIQTHQLPITRLNVLSLDRESGPDSIPRRLLDIIVELNTIEYAAITIPSGRDEQWIVNLISKLPLVGLDIRDMYKPVATKLDLSVLQNIKTLKRLNIGLSWFDRDGGDFITAMMRQVSILTTEYIVYEAELSIITNLLATNDATVEMLKIFTYEDLTELGKALETNTTLKSLTFLVPPGDSFAPIYDGLVHNTSLLKLSGYYEDGCAASLSTLLRTNTMLEKLKLMVYMELKDPDRLVSILSQSKLISLTIELNRDVDSTDFITSLLQALTTNTTLERLRIRGGAPQFSAARVDGLIVQNLLVNNKTLTTFRLPNVIVTDFPNPDLLFANETLTNVTILPSIIPNTVARRNRKNQTRRESTLFDLTSRTMF